MRSGKAFDYAEPDPDSICVKDIARGLALECRFGNQTADGPDGSPVHYSVAQHSVLVATHAQRLGGAEASLDGLLHDAAEAYLGDWPRPLKELIGKPLATIERVVELAIIERLGLKGVVTPGGGELVKWLDARALVTERRDLMAGAGESGRRPWVSCEGVEPFPERIEPWSAARAESAWLDMLGSLWVDLGLPFCGECELSEERLIGCGCGVLLCGDCVAGHREICDGRVGI